VLVLAQGIVRYLNRPKEGIDLTVEVVDL
jgi:hypothetical protein